MDRLVSQWCHGARKEGSRQDEKKSRKRRNVIVGQSTFQESRRISDYRREEVKLAPDARKKGTRRGPRRGEKASDNWPGSAGIAERPMKCKKSLCSGRKRKTGNRGKGIEHP